jgi:hypothetical protein
MRNTSEPVRGIYRKEVALSRPFDGQYFHDGDLTWLGQKKVSNALPAALSEPTLI